MGKFHSREGLFFERTADDGVVISIEKPVRDDTPAGKRIGSVSMERIRLSAEEWASVVASVSKHGESSATWQEALRFQRGY